MAAETDYSVISHIIAYLEAHFRDQPELKDIAAEVGLSEFHVQRLFQQWAGISPKRFVQYLTAEYARDRLHHCANVLDTAYAAGLSGPSRLHDLTVNVYAMTPAEVRRQGRDLVIDYGIHPSPFGDCLIGITARGVCQLDFVPPGGPDMVLDAMRHNWPGATFRPNTAATARVLAQIFDHDRRGPLAVLVKGTNFQIRVWEALLRIPPGALVTYRDVAAHIGHPRSARAVGNAVGSNSVGYLIPCHRVIRASGVVGSYRWNTARKRAMIAWEAAHEASR